MTLTYKTNKRCRQFACYCLMIVVCVLLCLPTQAQHRNDSQPQSTHKEPPTPRELITSTDPNLIPESGEPPADSYANRYSGFRVSFPAEWFAINQTGIKQAQETGANRLGVDPKEQERIDHYADKTPTLFSVTQFLRPPPGQMSATVMCLAEPLTVMNLTPLRYMQAVRDSALPHMGIKFEVAQDAHTETLGEHSSAAMTVKVYMADKTFNMMQEYHAVIT